VHPYKGLGWRGSKQIVWCPPASGKEISDRNFRGQRNWDLEHQTPVKKTKKGIHPGGQEEETTNQPKTRLRVRRTQPEKKKKKKKKKNGVKR